MIKGIYTSASGMLPRILKQEAFANNMANVNTPGFKKDGVFLEVLDRATQKEIITDQPWEIPMVDDVSIDFSQGDLEKTDANTDFALRAEAFSRSRRKPVPCIPDPVISPFRRRGFWSTEMEIPY